MVRLLALNRGALMAVAEAATTGTTWASKGDVRRIAHCNGDAGVPQRIGEVTVDLTAVAAQHDLGALGRPAMLGPIVTRVHTWHSITRGGHSFQRSPCVLIDIDPDGNI